MNAEALVRPPRIFPIVIFLIALPLVIGGAQLLMLGGSVYYIVAGLVLAFSGYRLWEGDAVGSKIYGFFLAATVVWALYESGTNLWALSPRILPLAVLGSWLLTPWARRALYAGAPPPLFQSTLSKVAPALVFVLLLSVVISGSGWEVTPLSERSGINTVNSRTDWPQYGNTYGGSRYSPADEINTDNVSELEVAWTYRTGQGGAFKATPIQVGDLLYVCTGGNVVIALDAETGELRWQHDPEVADDYSGFLGLRYFTTTCRGVTYYEAPPGYDGECQKRILTATTDTRLIAINAITGERCDAFGEQGNVNLTLNMGEDPRNMNFQTSPPAIVRGNAVVGGWVWDNLRVGEPSGAVRAFDALSGEFSWAWDMGRPGDNAEPPEGETYTRGTPNIWSIFSIDEERGLIYGPTGNETPDYFGGQRMEASEQFASSVVAIDGDNGSVRWSFQTTHHDIWDYDVPSQPVLIDLPGENGEKIPALLAPTKRSEIFVLNRETGEPIFDIQELPVPQTGGVPEDFVAATQPFSMDLPDFRPNLSEATMWGVTPLDQLWCRIEFRKMRYEGHFTVPGLQTMIQSPGNIGGHNWGSVSVDQANNIVVVNPMVMANLVTLYPQDDLPEGVQPDQAGTPYSKTADLFLSPLDVPCQQPPYGVLAAIDLESRELLWERPIGSAKESGPMGIKSYLPLTIGTPQTGGTVTTAGGLIFISGTFDNTIRAVNLLDGRELWQNPLPFSSHATPMSYVSPQGKQTVVVTVPVHNSNQANGMGVIAAEDEDPEGGYVIAYRLPD